MSDILKIRDLSVSLLKEGKVKTVVKNLTFSIRDNEFFGLVGESGCGKSTLAGAILRILRPPFCISSGSIHFGKSDLLKCNDNQMRLFRWQEIAIVFQSAMSCLNPVLTVEEQLIDTVLAHKDCSLKKAKSEALKYLIMVDLNASVLDMYPHQLSGGMRQRVNIAMALLLNPKLLILDEPTTALDVITQKKILDRIKSLQRTLGFSVLLITHDLPLVLDYCDRVAVMLDGNILELADSKDILNGPKHDYSKMLFQSFPSIFESQTAGVGKDFFEARP